MPPPIWPAPATSTCSNSTGREANVQSDDRRREEAAVDWLTGRGDVERRPEANPADADTARLADEVVPLVNEANGATWYEEYTNPVDIAVVQLCRLRRAGAGRAGLPRDDAAWARRLAALRRAGRVRHRAAAVR